jgi:hypothetical protein
VHGPSTRVGCVRLGSIGLGKPPTRAKAHATGQAVVQVHTVRPAGNVETPGPGQETRRGPGGPPHFPMDESPYTLTEHEGR